MNPQILLKTGINQNIFLIVIENGGIHIMKRFGLLLILAVTFGLSIGNANVPCKNCKKDSYSARNSENNRVVSYKKDGIGRNGVAVAAGVGGEKLSHARLSHNNKNIHHQKNM